jgi:tetratricopeptide (TPR) repeat protein
MAVLVGAAAGAPLLAESAMAQAGPSGDADALFKAGKFEQAGRAYEEILTTDPGNLRAARQRGYVALLSNKFPDAEKYLRMALELAPGDKETNQFLGDCYLRQDKFSLSVPHWQAAGNEIEATWFAAFRGEPYQLHGDTARLPWQQLDPFPLVEASVNGGPPKRFMFYTGAPGLGVSPAVAREAGLSPVASQEIDYLGGRALRHVGVLDSLTLGGMELRNIPVAWMESDSNAAVAVGNDGLIGTWLLYHLLPTIDYAGRALVLRRKTPETARKVRADAERAGAKPLPLYLARSHQLHSRGSIAGSGTRVMGVNFGGTGETAAGMSEETAKRLGVRIDYDRPVETFGHSQPVVVYPCYPKEIRFGEAVAREAYCFVSPTGSLAPNGFDVLGHFAHPFWKPYRVTLDFTDMSVYLVRG